MTRTQYKLIAVIWRSLLVLTLVAPAALAIDVSSAGADGWLPPLIRLIPAHMRRNRVYETAEDYMRDQNQYYDSLRATAAQQLLDRELTYGLRDNQVAAYIKVINLIEEERQTMIGFAEGEKKQARDQFIAAAGNELENLMLSTTPATQVLGAFANGINTSQGLIQGAITKLTGGSGGVLEDIAQVRRIGQRMGIAGQLIGGKLGEALRKGSARIADLTKPIDLIEADLTKVMEELGDLGVQVADLQAKGYKPTASQTAREVAITLVTGEGDPAIELIADLLVAKHGGGGGFHDRAKDVMLGAGAARCRAAVEQIRQVRFKMEIDPGGEVENEPEIFPTCSTADVPSLVDEIAAGEQPEAEEVAEAEEAAASGESEEEAAAEDTQEAETNGDAADSGPITSSAEYIWVLTDTVVNYNNDPTAFTGGGADPTWFPEARFEGKSLTYSCSAGSFSIAEANVDHGYEYFNVNLGVNYDAPPAQLDPGQEFELGATATHSGSVDQGNPGLAFQYHLNGVGQHPILVYSPWSPDFDGTASLDWTFSAPLTSSEGGEYIVGAGLWNVPPCNVTWTYQSQFNQNRVEEAPAEEAAQQPPAQTEADPVCEAKRAEVASKVDIARGADTADLALGIIGYLSASLGDVRVNYCEGGSGAAPKGTAIRVGDCVQTGANGRGKIVFNDRDDKYNAEPSSMYIARESELCFPNFTVHRDDGKPGVIELIQGAIRVITHGWRPGNSLGVDVRVKAAVTVASDVILEYDPDLDLLRTYVNEGSVGVTLLETGESQNLKDNQLLITAQDSIGEVERMSSRVWKDLLEDQELDLEEPSPDGGGFSLARLPLLLIGVGVCGGGALVLVVAGLLIYRKRKKDQDAASPSGDS